MTREKTDELDFIKLKTSAYQKTPLRKWKGKPHAKRNIHSIYIKLRTWIKKIFLKSETKRQNSSKGQLGKFEMEYYICVKLNVLSMLQNLEVKCHDACNLPSNGSIRTKFCTQMFVEVLFLIA